jgi:hypothetical protein
MLGLLTAAPTHIAELAAGLAPDRLRTAPRPDDWSVIDVLAHLRGCADVWGDTIRRILAEDRPTIPGGDPRARMREMGYLDLEFEPSLRAFAMQRADLLATLEPLSHEDWLRTARVKGSGAAVERTALFFVDKLVRHERLHMEQIARIVRQTAPNPSRRH